MWNMWKNVILIIIIHTYTHTHSHSHYILSIIQRTKLPLYTREYVEWDG